MFTLIQKNACATFTDQNQRIRIHPMEKNIFRITCTLQDEFCSAQSLIINAVAKDIDYILEETEGTYALVTRDYSLEISKMSGRIRIRDKEKSVIMSEPPKNGRTLTQFESYKNVFQNGGDVVFQDGVDGVRADSDNYSTVFYKKLCKCQLAFEFSDNEAIYGFGSHEEGFGNLRGKYRYLYQQNMKACVPYFYSTKGYGCLFDANCFMTFEDNENGSYVWLDAVEELDYYIILGDSFDSVTAGYRYLTGQAPLLPKWAFGYCQSKERYEDESQILHVVEEYRRRQVPLDLIILDWQSWPLPGGWGQKSFDPLRFPNPTEMIQKLHDMNARFMISVWPNMKDDCPNHVEMKNEDCLLGNQSTYDAFSEKARNLYWKQAQEGLFKHGVDAWWCDCTEPFQDDWHGNLKPQPHERININTAVGKKYLGEDKINAYSLMHSKGIYEGQRSVTSEKRVVNLTRSAFAGQHRYSTITWAGDTAATWETLKRHIPEGVNFCASGEPYWTVDIGAFFTRSKNPWFWCGEYEDGCDDLGYRELYTRWLQYGAFLPIFRSHGTDTPREIWNFGEKGSLFYDAIEKFIRLRYSLIPYIYSLAGKVTHENYTMMRALAFDFKDEKVKHIDHQYMFGDAIMVCPITRPMYYHSGSISIENDNKMFSVYLPKDVGWYDFWTGEYYEGGQEITKEYPIDSMPLFVKAGTYHSSVCTEG